MKKTVAGVLLMITTIVQGAEDQLSWSCNGVSSIGFLWQDGSWQDQAFQPSNYLFTLSPGSGNATLIFSGYQWNFSNCARSNVIRCSSNVGNAIVMNPETGAGAVSSLIGTALPPAEATAIAFMERIECSRV